MFSFGFSSVNASSFEMLVENEIARLISEKRVHSGAASPLSRVSQLVGTLISKLDISTVFCI
jgi:hypothetical protein